MRDAQTLVLGVGEDCSKPTLIIQAKTALSIKARAKGYSNRREQLKKNEAMLFIFRPPQLVSFWMKETHIPLQIGFFSSDGKLHEKYQMTVEEDPQNPIRRYESREKISMALEVAPGELNRVSRNSQLCVEKR